MWLQICQLSVIRKHLRVFLRFLLAIPSLKIRKINKCVLLQYQFAKSIILKQKSSFLFQFFSLHHAYYIQVRKRSVIKNIFADQGQALEICSQFIFNLFLETKDTNILVSHRFKFYCMKYACSAIKSNTLNYS